MQRKILVTGGAGYIGSHTVVELYNEGYTPIILDNFSNSSEKVIKRIAELVGETPTVEKVDLLDIEGIKKVFAKHDLFGVIHFAGLKSVNESIDSPLIYYKNNLISTFNLCEVMEEFEVKNLVFSSSATVYSADNKMPVSENGVTGAINPYGRTKLFIEEFLKDLFKSDSTWRISILRYFNPIGAHESGMIGENPKGIPNNLMPYITNVAVGKLEKLKVFGNDYNTEDGTGVRDYIHVTDLAKGHIRALEHLTNDIKIYNMGTGKGYSVLDVINAFEKATGIKIPYEIVERRPGDIAISYANAEKAKKELNWKAEKNLYEMCKDSWNWQSKNPNGYA